MCNRCEINLIASVGAINIRGGRGKYVAVLVSCTFVVRNFKSSIFDVGKCGKMSLTLRKMHTLHVTHKNDKFNLHARNASNYSHTPHINISASS